MSAGARPRPVPSALTAEFWEAARRRVLVRPCCGDCGHSFFTPQIACPRCLSERWSYAPSSGHGVVYSATVVHRAPFPGLQAPYHLGIIDLEEGWSMMSNIVGADGGGAVPVGTPVVVEFQEVDAALVLPVFRPAAADGAR